MKPIDFECASILRIIHTLQRVGLPRAQTVRAWNEFRDRHRELYQQQGRPLPSLLDFDTDLPSAFGIVTLDSVPHLLLEAQLMPKQYAFIETVPHRERILGVLRELVIMELIKEFPGLAQGAICYFRGDGAIIEADLHCADDGSRMFTVTNRLFGKENDLRPSGTVRLLKGQKFLSAYTLTRASFDIINQLPGQEESQRYWSLFPLGREDVKDWVVPFGHSIDFTTIRWDGKMYQLTKKQANIVRVMWEEMERGVPFNRRETILKAAQERDTERIDKALPELHRDRVVVKGERGGTWGLNPKFSPMNPQKTP